MFSLFSDVFQGGAEERNSDVDLGIISGKCEERVALEVNCEKGMKLMENVDDGCYTAPLVVDKDILLQLSPGVGDSICSFIKSNDVYLRSGNLRPTKK